MQTQVWVLQVSRLPVDTVDGSYAVPLGPKGSALDKFLHQILQPLVNGTIYYRYRGKGGKKAKRELPRPAYEAIQTALTAWGKSLGALDGKESLWPTDDTERAAKGLGVTSGTFYGNLQRYLRAAGLPPAGVHILRHSAAKLRRDAGESVEDVSRFLDHSSLAVTTVYLRRLEGQRTGAGAAWRKRSGCELMSTITATRVRFSAQEATEVIAIFHAESPLAT
jgi:hypothetical protein